jgi:hypothetical protein
MWRRRTGARRLDRIFPHIRHYFAGLSRQTDVDANPRPKHQEYIMHFTSRTVVLAAVAATAFLPFEAAQAQTLAPAGASVYFINIKDKDTVTSPFKVQFGLAGMGVAPAGVEKDKTGHHHLLIDSKLSDDEAKAPVAMDAQHMHFGGGQTETTLTLPPGQHTLQLVLGDWSHIPFSPLVASPVVTITVKQQAATMQKPGAPALAAGTHH